MAELLPTHPVAELHVDVVRYPGRISMTAA